MKRKILITGGAGFIGSHLVKHFVKKYTDYKIYNLDNLTYASNLKFLSDIESLQNYKFLKGDINDLNFLEQIFSKYLFDSVIHLAAESHVDRSIDNPSIFAQTNIIGTLNLLEKCKKYWGNFSKNNIFYHVSTDEVYGSLGEKGKFTEKTSYDPRSPYSASKASSDHFVRAYGETYNLPYYISNCSNNFGENQYPEKLIPVIINCIISNKNIPIYGNGKNIRDWLYVKDHVNAIDLIFHSGKLFQTYNIGTDNEWTNLDLVKLICSIMDKKLDLPQGNSETLIHYVLDRPGHDLRYAIDSSKLKNDLNWKSSRNPKRSCI